MKMLTTLIALSMAVFLSCCGQSLSGTYVDKQGIMSMAFGSGSKVIVGMPFVGKVEMSYEVEGENLKLTTPQGTQVYTILKDGSIQAPMGITLVKRKR